jgi:phage major head subunit gpT-like protein
MPLAGGTITRNSVPSELEVGLRKVIFNRYALRNKEYEDIYTVTDSKKRQETDSVIAGAGTYQQKDEGNPPYIDSMEEAYTRVYIHDTFALAMIITYEARKDELYGVLARMADELGDAAGYTQAVDAMDIFNDPTGTSPGLYTADGSAYPLLSTTHYLKTGGTWSNRTSTSVTLDGPALEAGLNAYRTNMVDQRGRKVAINPKWLMVGVDNQMVAARLLGSTQRPGGNDNDINPVKKLYPDLEPKVMDHLAQTGAWFLLGPKEKTDLVYFERETFNTAQETPGDGSRNLMHAGYYRVSHGATTPVGIYGSPGS